MTKLDKISLDTLNREFQSFQRKMISQKTPKPAYIISQLSQYEKKYKKIGLERNYAGDLFVFAGELDKTGHRDIPGIIYSNLVKMPFLSPNLKEHYALKALEYAKAQGDLIHQLARLTDLKIIYKQSKQTHRLKETLIEEEKILIEICSNFSNAKESFRTYARNNSPRAKYELELAKVRVDLAKIIMKNDPKKASIILTKALKTFKRQGRGKEADFVNLMLSQIKEKQG